MSKTLAREDEIFDYSLLRSRSFKGAFALCQITTQCPYCIEAHSKAGKLAGATREEAVEAAFVAAALRAGAAATHGAMALTLFDKQE